MAFTSLFIHAPTMFPISTKRDLGSCKLVLPLKGNLLLCRYQGKVEISYFQSEQKLIASDNSDKNPREELKAERMDEQKKSKMVEVIKATLRSMEDGDISVSAYDTAWVAMVENIFGNGGPQFPTSLRWISENQLEDGSWGDEHFILPDRLLSTLTCVVALKSWCVEPNKCERGVGFLVRNIDRLGGDEEKHRTIGFDLVFTHLLDTARSLKVELPYDSEVLQKLFEMRRQKLRRIPKEMLHKTPTPVLYSLEGMHGEDLNWDKLLELRCTDGSFLFSPSSTAYALMHTKDQKCLQYLRNMVDKYNGGVPNVYPVDLFERLWCVDRLQRLGISRHFKQEIKEILDYVDRYWTDTGISWSRNPRLCDIDDTSMGFRLLRLNGYHISCDVYEKYKQGEEFHNYPGQLGYSLTPVYNLYRASELAFPGEHILDEAKKFSYNYLKERQASDSLVDKWSISKDFPGEVGYALDYPLYARLPRIETSIYLQQYGGSDDLWIGKVPYRMHSVNNNYYLDLAKVDFNKCQAIHQVELHDLKRWGAELGLEKFGIGEDQIVKEYFLAASSIFEPERVLERIGWAQTGLLMKIVSSSNGTFTGRNEMMQAFSKIIHQIQNSKTDDIRSKNDEILKVLLKTLEKLSSKIHQPMGGYKHHFFHQMQRAWLDWMETQHNKASTQMALPFQNSDIGLLVRMVELCANRLTLENWLLDPQNNVQFEDLTISASMINHCRLSSAIPTGPDQARTSKVHNRKIKHIPRNGTLEMEMKKLVSCVIASYDEEVYNTKQTFLTIAKSFYYTNHCPHEAFISHVSKVLFEPAT